jgi:hypothetical protein
VPDGDAVEILGEPRRGSDRLPRPDPHGGDPILEVGAHALDEILDRARPA